ncbi:MAG: enoyl-CoA hydratase/isomerase family protein [Proteobacteria bacterium]|nr:enoyl-CoA hydratase/isomerase family protein [Pseudomonadota bacterium]
MTYQDVIFEKHGAAALLTFNRPAKLNAISPSLRNETIEAIGEARADDSIRALVITGAGRGFCSGADLSVAQSGIRGTLPPPATQEERLDEDGWMGRWAKMWQAFDKPIVAAVNGIAAGAGMSTALAADLRIGSERARFRTMFIERNLSPDSGMSYFLPRIAGYSRAADLIFTSREVDAQEAYRLGIIDRLVEHDRLIEASLALAREIAQWPPLAMRASKRVLQRNFDADLDSAVRNEAAGLALARRATEDTKESLLAFTEKRRPNFTGK